MSRQTLGEQGHEKLGANRFGVATQGIHVATRTMLLNTIYVATLSKYVMTLSKYVMTLSKYVTTQSKSKPREQVMTKHKKLQQRQRQRLKALSRQTFLCRDKETNLGQNFRNPQRN